MQFQFIDFTFISLLRFVTIFQNFSRFVLGLSSIAGQDLVLGQTFHSNISKEPVEDIDWYRVTQDGKEVKMAYCDPSSSCKLVESCISSCPEYLTRLKTDGLSIILSSVTQADRGLEFQMQMHFKIMTGKAPRVYMIKIKNVSPREGQCVNLRFCSL